MNRSVLPLALAVVALTLLAPLLRAVDAPVQPNFVLILMDDMGYGDIGPFNAKTKNRTPNLDGMAKEGMKLTSFYAAPVCTPSHITSAKLMRALRQFGCLQPSDLRTSMWRILSCQGFISSTK